ncbi:non-homologous end-joining DNA ligase [Streptomyces orinoci]|uniref:DNA ligase (ATP) n=1 Tax=Streptomyces orinoci TaxID=67339 RepID=A0ABV3K5C8_STRON|nr:non-homologous end-joining DNA ligase [Streptomyces orinoci]
MSFSPVRLPGALPDLRPMLATPGPLPVDTEADWGFEVKWDGARCILNAPGDGTLRILNRGGHEVTGTYPELGALGEQLRGRPAVLDGEVVVLDEGGRPDFGLLQQRVGIFNPRRTAHLAMKYPAHLMLFDVMFLDGESLLTVPYRERRAVLSGLDLNGRNWSTPAHLEGHARQAWDATLRHGFEGVVCKELSSLYIPGVVSPRWRKVKHLLTLEVLIGGWTEGRGALAGLPGAILAGIPEANGLRYVGAVGTGFSDEERRLLGSYLAALPRADSPFASPVGASDAHWVEPRLVAEISYTGWTTGRQMRNAVWNRLRPDLTLPG